MKLVDWLRWMFGPIVAFAGLVLTAYGLKIGRVNASYPFYRFVDDPDLVLTGIGVLLICIGIMIIGRDQK